MQRKNPKPVKQLVKLWKFLTPTMRERLTRLMKSTPGAMRQYVEGRRSISSDMAIKFEKATLTLGVDPISRMTLNETCRRCEFAKLACELQLDPVGIRGVQIARKFRVKHGGKVK